MISRRTSSIPKEAAAGERHQRRQALCKRLQHNCSHREECNTHVVVMVRKRRQKVKEVSVQRDPSPGRRVACNSPSQGTRFHQSRQSHAEHPGVSDGN